MRVMSSGAQLSYTESQLGSIPSIRTTLNAHLC